MRIHFACEATMEDWNPATVAAKGSGGSEIACIEMARRLSDRGNIVSVGCDTPEQRAFDGVPYVFRTTPVGPVDVLVAWRSTHELAGAARLRVAWCHDCTFSSEMADGLEAADIVFGLSEWHCMVLKHVYPHVADKVVQTANGVDLERFSRLDVDRDPLRAIYASCPMRGLVPLLRMWPEVRARVPGATLHAFYGIAPQLMEEQKKRLLAAIKAAPDGVVFHDRVNRDQLAVEMLSSSVALFPSYVEAKKEPFGETSCLACQEATAAGCRIVATPVAALAETAAGGYLASGEPGSPEWEASFVDAIVAAYNGNRVQDASRFDWENVVDQWEDVFGAPGIMKPAFQLPPRARLIEARLNARMGIDELAAKLDEPEMILRGQEAGLIPVTERDVERWLQATTGRC